MESNDELKEFDIKNGTCYYFVDIIKIEILILILVVKIGITYFISYNYTEIKVDSYNSLPVEKTSTFHNALIFIKTVFNKDENNFY